MGVYGSIDGDCLSGRVSRGRRWWSCGVVELSSICMVHRGERGERTEVPGLLVVLSQATRATLVLQGRTPKSQALGADGQGPGETSAKELSSCHADVSWKCCNMLLLIIRVCIFMYLYVYII